MAQVKLIKGSIFKKFANWLDGKFKDNEHKSSGEKVAKELDITYVKLWCNWWLFQILIKWKLLYTAKFLLSIRSKSGWIGDKPS